MRTTQPLVLLLMRREKRIVFRALAGAAWSHLEVVERLRRHQRSYLYNLSMKYILNFHLHTLWEPRHLCLNIHTPTHAQTRCCVNVTNNQVGVIRSLSVVSIQSRVYVRLRPGHWHGRRDGRRLGGVSHKNDRLASRVDTVTQEKIPKLKLLRVFF